MMIAGNETKPSIKRKNEYARITFFWGKQKSNPAS
jgi:hypothetical protein